jgi:hypothetical protein
LKEFFELSVFGPPEAHRADPGVVPQSHQVGGREYPLAPEAEFLVTKNNLRGLAGDGVPAIMPIGVNDHVLPHHASSLTAAGTGLPRSSG